MTFYVRRSQDSEIEGPLTEEQVKQLMRQKRVTLESLVLPDAGKGLQEVSNLPMNHWTRLANLPTFALSAAEERKHVLLLVTILILLVLVPILVLAWFVAKLRTIH